MGLYSSHHHLQQHDQGHQHWPPPQLQVGNKMWMRTGGSIPSSACPTASCPSPCSRPCSATGGRGCSPPTPGCLSPASSSTTIRSFIRAIKCDYLLSYEFNNGFNPISEGRGLIQ